MASPARTWCAAEPELVACGEEVPDAVPEGEVPVPVPVPEPEPELVPEPESLPVPVVVLEEPPETVVPGRLTVDFAARAWYSERERVALAAVLGGR